MPRTIPPPPVRSLGSRSKPVGEGVQTVAGYQIGEFDVDGRTYRIRTDSSVYFFPHFFVNQVRDSVGTYEDLLTGDQILVNWQNVGVVRIIETSKS